MRFSHQLLVYVRANRSRFLAELTEFVRFQSISAQPEHADDVKSCAAWLARHLQKVGLENVRTIPTARHPIVYAEWQHAPRRPTILIYGHYDVQPADPLDQWKSPPFEPIVRGNDLYSRGASDDKGQMFAHVKALEAYLKTVGVLPVNVKCIFEGEEEIGSSNLISFLESNKRALSADAAFVSDMPMPSAGQPAITYALRGALSTELEVTGAQHDLHSGIFGGAVPNPLQALCQIVAKLHDEQGRVAIPGFYDHVRESSEEERTYMAQTGPTDEQILQNAEADGAWGELGYSLYERTTIRPALSINGISGGYQGHGGKAVIPTHALVKLNFRLVPDQDPHEIESQFRRHIAAITPPAIRCRTRTNFGAKPVLVNFRHPAVRAAAIAGRKGFATSPVFLRSGGSIPVVNTFQETLGIPTVLMGFALPDDGMHAPNEKFHLPNFYRGISTSIWFLSEVASRKETNTGVLDKSSATPPVWTLG
jgi:acetylornithine deacetylase/succinyl-diaminopimelate desuccinylase-like protein